jgi:pyruvate-formate lyase-activating enzyme
MTKIYNITQYIDDDSIYVLFDKCNFNCTGCIRKESKYDSHLAAGSSGNVQAVKDFHQLSLEEFEGIIKKLRVKRATLGGGEPTLDSELPDVVEFLEGLGIRTMLLTNGYVLNEKLIERLRKAGLSGVQVSIKAYDDGIHRLNTGKTNKLVLAHFRILAKSPIRLIAESVLIPGLIEEDEIEKIAEFVASVNPVIPFRIDGFIPSKNVPWRRPSSDEVMQAVRLAQKHLWIVSYLNRETLNRSKAVNIYP